MFRYVGVGGVLAAWLAAAPALAGDLELVEVQEVIHTSLRWVSFTGWVRNSSQYVGRSVEITITLKRAGRVIAVCQDDIEGVEEGLLNPGESGPFEVLTGFTRSEFDSWSYRLDARWTEVGAGYLSGDIVLLEDTVSLRGDESFCRLLGEVRNGTSAVLTNVELRVLLFDAEDRLLKAVSLYELADEFAPGDVWPFSAYASVDVATVARWQMTWTYTASRIPPLVTGVSVSSWGRIKQAR